MMRRLAIGAGATMVLVGLAGCDEKPVSVIYEIPTEPTRATTTTTTLPADDQPGMKQVVRLGTQPRRATTTLITTTTTTAIVATTTTTEPPVTTTTESLAARQFQMYERGSAVARLQEQIGMESVDGIYGPVTRRAHIDYLGGPHEALAVFYPDLAYPVPTGSTTLGELIDRYFQPGDRAWATRVAFCESSGLPHHTGSTEVSSAFAIGWFQHLAKYWSERSEKAGVLGASPFDSEANVVVAAWLFYEGGGARHWNPSRTCWEEG